MIERAHAAVQQVKPAVRRAWHGHVRRRAVDDTTRSATRTCVVVAPHPDDETFGCGATIARKTAAGTTVDVIVVTDGRASHRSDRIAPDELADIRTRELHTATRALGMPDGHVHQLGVRDGELIPSRRQVRDELADRLLDLAPDDVLVTSGLDWHDDHRVTSEIVREIFPALRLGTELVEFPIWWWADGPWPMRPPGASVPVRALRLVGDPLRALGGPRPRAVATDGFLDCKRAAISAYASQTTNLTGEPGWAVLDDAWIEQFCGPVELFLPVT
ncbi:MAG: GlcNAc-PI de-N-acetylase [Actinomycetia bacterium]|nr:GlcNAc-PI de-N-acetylase [Actinomycetes bacterium]